MIYGQKDDNAIITRYVNSNLENGIKQCNLDFILDLIDEYVELIEALSIKEDLNMEEQRKVNMNGDEGSPVEPTEKKTINIVLTKNSLKLKGHEGEVDIKKFEKKG